MRCVPDSAINALRLTRVQQPALVGEILTRIQAISDEAQRALADPELERSTMLAGLEVCSRL
jgi:hypothetical protein